MSCISKGIMKNASTDRPRYCPANRRERPWPAWAVRAAGGLCWPRRWLPVTQAREQEVRGTREALGSFASHVPPAVKDWESKDAKFTVKTALGALGSCVFSSPHFPKGRQLYNENCSARFHPSPHSQPLLETEPLCRAELLCRRKGCGYFWKPNRRC